AGLDDFQVKAVEIPMADGATLAADVYLPGAGKYPTILTITMSSKKQAVTKFFPRTAAWSSGDYALVCVERRGSAGSADNPRRQGINPDGWDGHDVVEWIAGQPWSDGKVGMWGASNQGKIQYATAMTNPPHLVAIMPAETRPTTREYRSIGLVYDAVYPGGVLRLEMLQNALGDEQRKAGQPGVGMAAMARKHALDDGFFER
ncbi:MAG: CocE/NonD family hydrolase, partial [bacterium]|nr:CocE/NonD family hydrolase [bacterium]